MAAAAIIAVLAGLNVYQFVTRDVPDEVAVRRPTRPATALVAGPPATMPATDRGVIDRYSELFYDAEETWRDRRWFGIHTLQNPNDLWVHQEIICELKPDFVIEAGTAHGGSAVIWSMILEHANPAGKVITIDIADECAGAREHPLWQKRVEFILGSSTDRKVVADLDSRTKGKKVLVILDSDHRRDHVLNELRAYSPMVNVGSYLIVQDTCINGHPVNKNYGPGPMEALEAFLASNDQFVPDRTREQMLHTMHPKGYLKRVK